MKFLKGYLSALPTWQKQELKNYLKTLFKSNKINAFNLTDNYVLKTSPNQIQFDRKPSDTYNSIFRYVDEDVNTLYALINTLSNQVTSYDLLIESLLKEVDKDIQTVQNLIEQEKSKRGDMAECLIEDFSYVENAEQYSSDTAYLFCDRNAKALSSCDMKNMCTLNIKNSTNLLVGNDGLPIAKIKIGGYQGIPNKSVDTPDKAIDGSIFSCWDAGHIADQKLEQGYRDFIFYGHYVDFTILLPKYTNITEISLTHSSSFPLEVCQIFINQVPILDKPVSVDVMMKKITNNLYGEEVRIILAQRHYTASHITYNDKKEDLEDLWNEAYGIEQFDLMQTKKDSNYYWNKYSKSIRGYIRTLIKGVE